METNIQTFDKVVDLDTVIAKSNNRLLKSFPRFMINIMKRIVRQDELNNIHIKIKNKIGMDYINGIIADLNIDVRMHNTGHLKRDGRFVFVANHPLGGVDAISFLHCVDKLADKVISPSNELFNFVPNLKPLIVGVNVFGKNNKEKSEAVIKAFESDHAIMIFPAGMVSRKLGGRIKDLEWHKSFITKSVQTKRDVVPVFITGKNSSRFYRVARLRKLLGIRMSIETILLPQEMLRRRNTSIDLYFGDPIPWTTFDKSKSHQEWANYVKEVVYTIGNSVVSAN